MLRLTFIIIIVASCSMEWTVTTLNAQMRAERKFIDDIEFMARAQAAGMRTNAMYSATVCRCMRCVKNKYTLVPTATYKTDYKILHFNEPQFSYSLFACPNEIRVSFGELECDFGYGTIHKYSFREHKKSNLMTAVMRKTKQWFTPAYSPFLLFSNETLIADYLRLPLCLTLPPQKMDTK